MSEPNSNQNSETPLVPQNSDSGGDVIPIPPENNVPPLPTPTPASPESPPLVESAAQQEVEDWRLVLPEGIRDHEKLKSFTSPEQAAQAIIDAKEPLEIPNAENYRFKDGSEVSKDFGEHLHKQGFTQAQVDSMTEMRSGLDVAERNTRVHGYAEELKGVFTQWGEDSDKNKNLAASALKQFDPKGEVTEMLKTSGEAFNPKVVKFFHRIGASLSEHQLLRMTTPSRQKNDKSAGELFYASVD